MYLWNYKEFNTLTHLSHAWYWAQHDIWQFNVILKWYSYLLQKCKLVCHFITKTVRCWQQFNTQTTCYLCEIATGKYSLMHSRNYLHANTVNDLHEDMGKNSDTISEVTRNLEAVFTSVTQQSHTYLKNRKNSCISYQ